MAKNNTSRKYDKDKVKDVLDSLDDFIQNSRLQVEDYKQKSNELAELASSLKDQSDILLTRLAIEFGMPFDDPEKLKEFIKLHKNDQS